MPDEHTTVLFHVPTPGLSRTGLRAFAASLGERIAEKRPFCCLITSDGELRRLNREFRKHDYATDVLSFPSGTPENLGEIAISFERVKAQAAEQGHGVEEEARILMLHGLLHLLGYDHETDGGQMARTERKWRQALRLPPGLIERVHS